MVWVKIDDQFHANPKMLSVGLAGTGLYARSLAYCGCYLTDGFVPSSWAWGQISQQDDPTIISWLKEAGLWIEVPGGYEIPDYLEYNPSRAEVEEEREKKREAGRLGGLKSGAARRRQAESKQMLEQPLEQMPSTTPSENGVDAQAERQAESKPVPVPEPVPGRQASKSDSQGISEARPEELLPIEKMRLATELKAVAPVSAEGAATIDALCLSLPEGSLAKVLESVAAKRGQIGPGYIINALRSEQRELADRSVA